MSNLILNGKTTVPGGTFEEVNIDGLPTIVGDLSCDIMKADGVGKFRGNVTVKGKADIDGVFNVYGNMDVEDLDLDGTFKVFGDLNAEGMEVEGLLKVSKSITAENIKLTGFVSLKGTLNAGSLDITFYNSPKVKEVVGGRISIRRGSTTRRFRAELIEGDEISVERSKVGMIRGDSVIIGEGCTIDRVEYRSNLDIHPKAVVKEKVKLS